MAPPVARINPAYPAVTFQEEAANRKLAPIRLDPVKGSNRKRPIPIGPYCSATYVTIQATCPSTCRFKAGNGCFAESGITGKTVMSLDIEARERTMTALDVARMEAMAMDEAFHGGPVPQDGGRDGKRGRDLRLHISGDVGDEECALILARAADRWHVRGGGVVWAYTHRWREIPRAAWGRIAVLASCETPEDVTAAIARGYAVALVVRDFNGGRRAYSVPAMSTRIMPCPAETGDTSCVRCRACFDPVKLRALNLAIGFSAHGRDGAKARTRLPIWDSLFGHIR
jgi:hypothetical protein